jgi:hypothetical protein
LRDCNWVEDSACRRNGSAERQEQTANRKSEPEVHSSSLSLGCEELLKAGFVAVTICLGLLLLTPWALAASLLTGSVRDSHGAPIAAAGVTGLDTSGAAIGMAKTDPDGTFALSTPSEPASVRVECPYCRAATVAVVPGQPVVAIMQRYDAVIADGPTSADLAALPYVQIENALALRPFEVRHLQFYPTAAIGPAISDRGLATSSLILNGQASTYFMGGQGNGFSTTPTHAGDLPSFIPASQAYQYGAYASGGIIQLTRDPALYEQAGFGQSSFLRFSAGTPVLGATLATDADDLTQRERAIGSGALPVLGGTLAVQVSASRASTFTGFQTVNLSDDSASFDFTRPLGRMLLRLSAAGASGTDGFSFSPGTVWSNVTARAALGARVGAFDLEAGSAYINGANYLPPHSVSTYPQATIYLKAHVAGPTSIDAGIANTAFRNTASGQGLDATLPSILITQSLGAFAVAAGFSQALISLAGFDAGYVASLAEAHFDYGDGKRLRAEFQTYRQTHEGELQPLSGTGLSLEYQLTPTTSVRAWSLRLFGDEPLYAADAYVSGDSIWVTNQNGGFRFDAIYRRMAGNYIFRRTLDGDVYFPISARASIGFRSDLRPQGRRTAILLSLQP